MIRKVLPFALAAIGVGVGFAGFAQAESDAPSYTIEDVTACSKDALRLCRDKLADLGAIEGCMKAKFDDLSPKCKTRFKDR